MSHEVMTAMKNKKSIAKHFCAALVLGCISAAPAVAEISASEIARLGRDLTPLGGERAGNAAGTIPAWNGGITRPPSGFSIGEHHRDPFARDNPLFVINAGNMDRYRDRLTWGTSAC